MILREPIHSNYNDLDVTIDGIRNRLVSSGALSQSSYSIYLLHPIKASMLEIAFSSGNYQLSDIKPIGCRLTLFRTMWQNKTAVTDETYDETNAVYEAKITCRRTAGWSLLCRYRTVIRYGSMARKVPGRRRSISVFVGCQIDKGTHRVKIHFSRH